MMDYAARSCELQGLSLRWRIHAYRSWFGLRPRHRI